jgi:hypothetical protein
MSRPRNYLDYLNPTTSKLWRTAVGNDYDLQKMTLFSANPDVDTGTLPEFVWSQGGVFTFPSAAAVPVVVSGSANDTAAGTGARTITVTGLDANYKEVVETVTLNGTSNVNMVASLLRINKMEVATAGSGAVNAGAITISIGGTIVSAIPADKGISQTGVFTIPADYEKAFLLDLFVNVSQGGSGSCTIQLRKRLPSGLLQEIVSYSIDTQGTSFIDRNLIDEPLVFEPKTDIWFNVPACTANNTFVGTIWKFVLLKKGAQ